MMIPKIAKKFLLLVFSQSLLLGTTVYAGDQSDVSTTPADRLSEGGWKARWEGEVKAIEENKDTQLVFLGDSITEGWDSRGSHVWKKEYEAYHPINFGIGGDRTEHLIWRIQNADLASLKPKVAVIMIGTNNTGHQQRDPRETARGVRTVVKDLRKLWPDTQLLLLAIFPRGETPDDNLRKINAGVNKIISRLDDGKHIHYLDINQAFLTEDGTLSKDIMPDLLHPNEKGYEIWAEQIKPELEKLGLK
ncbi:GDSL family lipase [Luteolibacter pohnpeiensis]|uniref:GDSL family lipase n=1 Tax=Luteolibacter pohnpeiensis TaxID=454153 RepID=A0A934SAN7_9BACT|nr:GDSL-type esterase/lipase family protein [Luteolibacter pohnpeiensis]MBK1883996.1 GDSL family lipase [Luteolibacter pohnpeiensis]